METERRVTRDIKIEPGKGVSIATEDIIAIGGVIVSILIALGIAFLDVDGKTGAAIIVPLLGISGIAQIIKAKKLSASNTSH